MEADTLDVGDEQELEERLKLEALAQEVITRVLMDPMVRFLTQARILMRVRFLMRLLTDPSVRFLMYPLLLMDHLARLLTYPPVGPSMRPAMYPLRLLVSVHHSSLLAFRTDRPRLMLQAIQDRPGDCSTTARSSSRSLARRRGTSTTVARAARHGRFSSGAIS